MLQDEYAKYFTWRKHYSVIRRFPICALCEMLHDPTLPAKSYSNLKEWWYGRNSDFCIDGHEMPYALSQCMKFNISINNQFLLNSVDSVSKNEALISYILIRILCENTLSNIRGKEDESFCCCFFSGRHQYSFVIIPNKQQTVTISCSSKFL